MTTLSDCTKHDLCTMPFCPLDQDARTTIMTKEVPSCYSLAKPLMKDQKYPPENAIASEAVAGPAFGNQFDMREDSRKLHPKQDSQAVNKKARAVGAELGPGNHDQSCPEKSATETSGTSGIIPFPISLVPGSLRWRQARGLLTTSDLVRLYREIRHPCVAHDIPLPDDLIERGGTRG